MKFDKIKGKLKYYLVTLVLHIYIGKGKAKGRN